MNNNKLSDLIRALQIFLKYDDSTYPFQCEHDELFMNGEYFPDKMDSADVAELKKLGFEWNDMYEAFYSFRFGSG